MNRTIFTLTIPLALHACADEVPGIEPDLTELYFPIGITTVRDASGADAYVVVASSNFDQRFNAGTVMALDVDRLFEKAGDGSSLVFDDAIGEARVAAVPVFSFAGDIVYVPTSSNSGPGKVFVAARGRNRLTMVEIDTETEDGAAVLSCATPGVEPLPTTGCTPAYVVHTGFADPFSLAHAPATDSRPDLIGVGHIQRVQDDNVIFGAVALANVRAFERRVQLEADGMTLEEGDPSDRDGDGLPDAITTTRVPSFGGVSGIAFAGELAGQENSFLTAGFGTAPDLLLASFQARADAVSPYALFPGPSLRLSAALSAFEARSLVIATSTSGARRAYASVRFIASGDSSNAGIAVIDLTDDRFEVLSVLEVGEELQRPFIREAGGARLLYVGDIRRDKLYVVDVTSDRPILVKEIGGRTTRMFDGTPVQVALLDSPSQITFATRGDRTLGFVTNFGNSTLAVLDVSSPDPRTHRIIARIGRNIDAEGETEGP